jgi:hypothetical protein
VHCSLYSTNFSQFWVNVPVRRCGRRSPRKSRYVASHQRAGLFVMKVLALVSDLAIRAATVSCRRTWLFERRLARANRCCAAANRSAAARPRRGLSTRSRPVAHDPDHQPVQAKLLGTKAEALEQRKSATETATEN